MAHGFPFVRPASDCALLPLSAQLQAQQPRVETPLAVRRGHSGAAAQQPAGGGGGDSAMGLGGKEVGGPGRLLTTAGKLLFDDAANTIVTYDVAPGKPLWRSRIGAMSSAAEAYLLDGHQYSL